ncbi:anti-sigma factor [Rhizobium sp. 0TCS1.26]|uniref:anti-sigma factor n=1 Tax=Rhizobium sp. 0TCS1.26 TaxID=3142623 RepID=UPI003D295AB2
MTFEDLPAIADDYVLGLLDEAETAEVEAELQRNAALSRAVAAARERFLPLDMTATPTDFPADLWARIEAQLPGQQPMDVVTAPAAEVARPDAAAANDNRVWRWRAGAFAGLAASLILAAGLTFSVTRTVEPLVVAVLVNEAGDVQAVVEDFGSERAVIRLLNDVSVPDDRTMQVWTLPSRDMGPVSIGLLDERRSARLDPPPLPLPQDAQLYEITLEPKGGSPTGRPTGPILAKGLAKLTR